MLVLIPSPKENQGEEAGVEFEETEGSSPLGGQCVPEKEWADEEDAWNPSPLDTDRSRWLVRDVSRADKLNHSTTHSQFLKPRELSKSPGKWSAAPGDRGTHKGCSEVLWCSWHLGLRAALTLVGGQC